MASIETDYLVIGGGASGMAFVDALISGCDADVVIVERRHRPGGHWNNAYPFVRLHQPSAFYGVNSRALGSDTIDSDGPNVGFYERATAPEICQYFNTVLEEHLLPSGQVRFLGMTDYVGDMCAKHGVVSRLTGRSTEVVVRRKVVDARLLEASIPAAHTPSFKVDEDVLFIPVNELVDLAGAGSGFTIVGAGKRPWTPVFGCSNKALTPTRLGGIRPWDPWLLDRRYQQPLKLLPALIEGVSLYLEAAAEAEDHNDLFRRLEDCGQLVRLDPRTRPTMFRCATVSQVELDALRTIEQVVRKGKVRGIGPDNITLDEGAIPTDRRQVHVDCSATGLPVPRSRPIFEPGRITLQQIRSCQPILSAALAAFVETSRTHDEERNLLCPANPYPSAAEDWVRTTLIAQEAQVRWSEPDIYAWLEQSRLNAARGLGDHRADPNMQTSLHRLLTYQTGAIET